MEKEHLLRVRIPKDLYKRYKLLCVEGDLSVPKQTAEIIRHFVEIQESNIEKIKNVKR